MKKTILEFLKNKLNLAVVIAIAFTVLFYLLMPLWVGFGISFVVCSSMVCFLFGTKLIVKSSSISNGNNDKKIKRAKSEIIFFAVLLFFLGAYTLIMLLKGNFSP